MDRFALFKRCTFINSGTSTLTVAAAINAAQGGLLVFDNCTLFGATNWTANSTVVMNSSGAAAIADGGIGVVIT
jgi:hypothetical protein